jgi:hypothetical protein
MKAQAAPSAGMSAPNGLDTERDDCDICGAKPVRIIVEGRGLCEQHRAEWIRDESHGSAGRVERVMAVLDRLLDEPSEGEWEDYLRRIAVAVIEATS